jgi:hypothetical protein
MNINSVFNARVAPRPEPARADSVARVDRREDDAEPRETSAPTRSQFSALLALLAGAGTNVRADVLRQLPADGVSLIDKMLDGTGAEADATGYAGDVSSSLLVSSSQRASDAMRYGMLKDAGAGDLTTDLAALSSALNDSGGSHRTRSGEELAHLNEVISRIVARNGATVDQLKARGDNEAADVRAALDALLAQAGTPTGLELAAAVDPSAMTATAVANAAALANAKAASAADVTSPVRDTDALAPELRQKLSRVIERMKNEYGHDVEVVETARAQERQDFLYEQGRTRPGAVVTWTRDSAHTRGEAVDVLVDGKWDNADGFGRLQRIAREEGLKTLGIRDPGHLEIESRGRSTEGESTAQSFDRRDARATPLIATTAAHSGVARVAGLAGVAGVARVADAGSHRGFDRLTSDSSETPAAAMTTLSATRPASERGQGHAFGRGDGDAQNRTLNNGRALGDVRREQLGSAEPSAFGALHTNSTIAVPLAAEGTSAPAGADAASRVADLQQMRDSSPAGSVSRMTLNIDTPDGGQDRITVDLRGTSVGTQINTDATSAEQLRLRTADLRDALGRHGLESESVRISSSSRVDANDAARIVSGDREGLRLTSTQQGAANDGTANQGQRERAANAREWDRPDHPESSRQSRDEQRDARQGAGQRGQRGTPNGSAS